MLGETMNVFDPGYGNDIRVFTYDLCEIHEMHWEAILAATKIKIFYVKLYKY